MTFSIMTTPGQRQPQIMIDPSQLTQMQAELQKRIADLEQLRVVLEIAAATNEPARFMAAAMAFCNQVATRYQAERVSLGFARHRDVRLVAMSHAEKFTRHMKLVQNLESAMEECLDQDIETFHPAPPGSTYVTRALQFLSQQNGNSAIAALPLRRGGEVVAVVLVERPADKMLAPKELEAIRLIGELVTPRLDDLHLSDRWIGARLAKTTRDYAGIAVGPKHTWAKLTALAVAGVLAFSLFVKGEYRVKAPFTFEATEKFVLSAPFTGFLKSVNVRVGDEIKEDGGKSSILAEFDTAELRSRLASAKAERLGYLRQADIARRDVKKTAEAQVNELQAEKTQYNIDLLEYQINSATIRAPLTGVVFKGDLYQRVGAKFETGTALFEVGRLDAIRGELSVAEEDILDLKPGQTGELAAASFPTKRIRFTVERITPMAEMTKNQNTFKVRVKLDHADLANWMKPGMDGIAKVDIDRRSYAWIWTHSLINWIRMKLWI